MTQTRYFRPTTVAEALTLLKDAVPLAGGTELLRATKKPEAYVDLQALGLDELLVSGVEITIGAMVRLQALVEAGEEISPALVQACVNERGWNLRNMRTVGGSLAATDGRSPVMTMLLAMKPEVILAPGDTAVDMNELLDSRPAALLGKLILRLTMVKPASAAYAQVSRTPKDLPVVCAAAARFAGAAPSFGIALGGYGNRPIRVPAAEKALADGASSENIHALIRDAYQHASDCWASGEYRSEAAAVLVDRLVEEVRA
ncbi:MAG: FAD binding domain-containing protein [Anaerolineales bacterium]|nr:FAD binding domain-containing protein [Anaerolineales bacterium]